MHRSPLFSLLFLLLPLPVLACGGAADTEPSTADGGVNADANADSDEPDADLGDGYQRIAVDQPSPFSLTAYQGRLYWVNGTSSTCKYTEGSLQRAFLEGGNVETLHSPIFDPSNLIIDNGTLYFAERRSDGSVFSITPEGAGLSAIAVGQKRPMNIDVEGSQIYWSNYGTTLSNNAYNNDGSIASTSLTDEAPVETLGGAYKPSSLLVGDGTLYYSTSSAIGGSTYAIPVAGGTGMSTGLGTTYKLALHQGRLYGIGSDSSLVAYDLTTGEVEILVGSASKVRSFALAGDDLYVNLHGTDVFRISLVSDAESVAILEGREKITELLIEGDSLVWVESHDGPECGAGASEILRMPLPQL